MTGSLKKMLKCKKAKWLSGEALKIAVKRREVKSTGEKERYKHLNAEFQWRDCVLRTRKLLGMNWEEVSQGVLSKLNWIVQISGDIQMRILLDYTGTGSTKCEAGRLVCSPRSLCRNPPALRCPWERLPCPAPLGDLSSRPLLPAFTMATIMRLAQRFPPYQRASQSQDLGLVWGGRGWEEDTGLSAGLRNVSGVKEII